MNRNRNKFSRGNAKQDSRESSKPDAVYNICNSEVVKSFQQYSRELDEKHDRYERLFKISRDITIESKRLIFLLHTYQRGTPDGEKVLSEAESRFANLIKYNFGAIMKELYEFDIHQYLRAYTFGVQEFIEALSFYYYLKFEKFLTFEEMLRFITSHLKDQLPQERSQEGGEFVEKDEFEKSEKIVLTSKGEAVDEIKKFKEDRNVQVRKQSTGSETDAYNSNIFTMVDYVLGLNDLSGELMRYCINKISSGHIETAFDICRFLSHLYVGMLSVGFVSREYNRKMITVKQCLSKVEIACYTVRVRGSEIPKHMIASVLENVGDETEDDMNY